MVGFRPSPGVVPEGPASLPFVPLSVSGPMGRTVEDAAFLLAVIAGADMRDPASFPIDATDVGRPMPAQAALLARLRAFFERYEFPFCAGSQPPPFAATSTTFRPSAR